MRKSFSRVMCAVYQGSSGTNSVSVEAMEVKTVAIPAKETKKFNFLK